MIVLDNEMNFALKLINEHPKPDLGIILKKVLMRNSKSQEGKLDFTKIFWLVSNHSLQ